MYDFLVIGGGSAGVHTAFFLTKAGAHVALVEQSEIASGGSGAAGAFVTPRLGKGGPIQRWSNEAFRFSIDFYKKSPYFYRTSLLRLPKEGEDFTLYEPFLEEIVFEKRDGGFLFFDAGVVKAKEHLEFLAKDFQTYFFEARIEEKEGYYQVGELKAKEIVLATGAWDELIDVPFLHIGKTSGVRFDVKTSLKLPYSIHQKISISKNIDGIVAIGATHHRLTDPNPPTSALWLFEEAKRMVGDFVYEVEKLYCGIRSSVNDHLPIIGRLVDISRIDQKDYRKIDLERLPKKNISIINGLGGRGFVFGPYMAKLLSDVLVNKEQIPEELDVNRYYKRWIKRCKR